MNYYNEMDGKKAAWLRELIKANVVAPGVVDERSIESVQPSDLAGFRQCHFFAGIGVWSYALRLAGWPDDRECWTGSCPCQPFSAAGKRAGFADERHLFPAWFRLIEARRPLVVFGEQVSSPDGLAWLDIVRSSMDAAGYTCGALDTTSASVGAPNIRQRLYFVGHATEEGLSLRAGEAVSGRKARGFDQRSGDASFVADADQARPQGRSLGGDGAGERAARAGGVACGMADADGGLAGDGDVQRGREHGLLAQGSKPGPVNGFWADAEWVWCRDEKWRPAQSAPVGMAPGLAADLGRVRLPGGRDVFFPLQQGSKARVLRLRGYGDAINTEVAAAFVRAYLAHA